MKRILSLMTAFVFCTTMLSAKTIYCKMAQDWWKADGAAVGCHSWGTGEGTDWPGVRMTPVAGETDLWSIDLDTDQVQNVIFTRVNPSDEDDLDWGAKTKDLQIPNDDKNLFTITSSEAVWGDPGCDGEWSVYGEVPTVEYYLVGWINGADSGSDSDYEALHEEYKFVNGTLVTTFTKLSYVYVKTGDNKNWYMASSYVEPAESNSVILSIASDEIKEKVAVNQNVEITFTLTENGDGTITLAYEEKKETALSTINAKKEARKVMYGNQMVIVRGENRFNVLGAEVK